MISTELKKKNRQDEDEMLQQYRKSRMQSEQKNRVNKQIIRTLPLTTKGEKPIIRTLPETNPGTETNTGTRRGGNTVNIKNRTTTREKQRDLQRYINRLKKW